MGPESETAKHVNHTQIATNPLAHPPYTDRATNPHAPANTPKTCYNNAAVYVQQDLRWYMLSLSQCRAELSIFERFFANPGSEQTRPLEGLSTHPARRVGHGTR